MFRHSRGGVLSAFFMVQLLSTDVPLLPYLQLETKQLNKKTKKVIRVLS